MPFRYYVYLSSKECFLGAENGIFLFKKIPCCSSFCSEGSLQRTHTTSLKLSQVLPTAAQEKGPGLLSSSRRSAQRHSEGSSAPPVLCRVHFMTCLFITQTKLEVGQSQEVKLPATPAQGTTDSALLMSRLSLCCKIWITLCGTPGPNKPILLDPHH